MGTLSPLISGVVVALPNQRAGAYDYLPGCQTTDYKSHQTISYTFAGSEWNQSGSAGTLVTLARNAFGLWNTPLDYDGGHLSTTVEQLQSTYHFTIAWYDGGASNTLAQTYCDDRYIEFNRHYLGSDLSLDFRNTTGLMTQSAAHEMGHAFGMSHTGTQDSFDTKVPQLSTCIPVGGPYPTTLAQDDAAQITRIHSTTGRPAQANFGFEQGLSYWGFTGGNSQYKTSGGATGPGWLAFKPNDPSADYGYQTATIAKPLNQSVNVKGNAKYFASTDHGNVEIDIITQPRQYTGTNSTCAAEYQTGKDEATVVATGPFTVSESYKFAPGSDWVAGTSPSIALGNSDAVAVRAAVHNWTQTSANVQDSVGIDNLRVQLISGPA